MSTQQEGLTHWDTGTGTLTPCQMDPETWFPPMGGSPRTAKRFCATCPAIDACLKVAMRDEAGTGIKDRFGVWGGLTPTERWRLEKERKKP